MAVNRIDWTTAARGARVVPALLIGGLPYLIVPPKVAIASVSWTGDADGAFFVGTSPSTKGWLDTSEDAPSLIVEEHASPVQGTIDVGDITFHLYDVAGEVTRLLSSRTTPYALLAADLTSSGTVITVDAIDLYAASGVVHLGRERIAYTGKAGSTLTGCTRGTAGTRAQRYVAAERHRVYHPASGVDILPSVLDRRITLWALRLSDAGVATDPTLLYDGRGAIGVGITEEGARWQIPTRHVSKILSEKASAPVVMAYGYQHKSGSNSGGTWRSGATDDARLNPGPNPMVATWLPTSGNGARVLLTGASGAPDNSGYSATREIFLANWNAAARAVSSNMAARLDDQGHVQVTAAASPNRRMVVWFGWEGTTVPYPDQSGDTVAVASVYSRRPMPPACVWLGSLDTISAASGNVTFAPNDVAQIPSLPSNPLTDNVYSYWTLNATRDNGITPKAEIVSRIIAKDVGANTLGLSPLTDPALGPAGYLLTRPTPCAIGLEAQGPHWYTCLRYGVFDQIDAVRGMDWLSDSISWSDITALAEANPGLGSSFRQYLIDTRAPLLDVLLNEARLHGFSLCTRRGRVSFASFREVSPSDPKLVTFTTRDLRERELQSSDTARDGLWTSMLLVFEESGDKVRVIDGGAVKESGQGEEVEVHVPRGCLPEGVASNRFFETYTALAMNMMSPWSRPYEVVTLPLSLKHAHLEIGDVVGVLEWMLPNREGTRGLHLPDSPSVGIPGCVIGRRVDLTAGTVDLEIRVSTSAYGYAPAALISAISGSNLTVDTTTLGGAGFAPDTLADGTARTDGGASFFSAGDKVQLLNIGATSPTTPFDAEVSGVTGATITLNGPPGATWEAHATAGRCMLVFDRWSVVVASQKVWAFVADDATEALSDGTTARRYV